MAGMVLKLALVVVLVIALGLPVPPTALASEKGTPAYQVIIPMDTGAETGLKAFPPKLEVGDGGKDNWIAVSHPQKEVPVGEYTYDKDGDQIAVNPNAGEIYVDGDTLVISSGTLSDKLKYDLEITDYTLTGGSTTMGAEDKLVVGGLRAQFRDYVYGSGSDLYQLEDTPQAQEEEPREITAVRVYAYVNGTKDKATAATGVLVGSKKFTGDTASLTSKEQRIGTTYYTNPATGLPWTWQEIDDLQAGISLKDGECSHVYVEVELVVHSQTFFPIDPVNVLAGDVDQWIDIDVSAHIPAGATGVLLHAVGTLDVAVLEPFGLRKKGSTDNRTNLMHYVNHYWAAIGVDASRTFQVYIGNTADWELLLVGYTMSGVTFRTNAVLKVPAATGNWLNVDASTEAPGAIGLIFEIRDTSGAYQDFGIRNDGSTDNRVVEIAHHYIFGAIIGCSASQIFEGWRDAATMEFWVVGFVTDGAAFHVNATDVSLGGINTWTDLTALPAPAIMGFYEIITTTNSKYGFRKNGSVEDIYLYVTKHAWAFVDCDDGRIVEGEILALYIDFFEVGYATADAPDVETHAATSIGATTATLGGNITGTGNFTVTNWSVVWDLNSQVEQHGPPAGNYTDFWLSPAGDYAVGNYTHAISGLATGTQYFHRFGGNNTLGWSWGDEGNFTTFDLPLPPTDFTATQSGIDEVTLTWTKGFEANNTVIRVGEDGCPASITDGYPVYNGNLTTATIGGLALGMHEYCFRGWSNNEVGNSTGYAEVKIGGEAMTDLVIIFLFIAPVGILAVGVFGRLMPFVVAAGATWLALSIYHLGFSTNQADIYNIMAWASMMPGIACVLAPLWFPRWRGGIDEREPSLDTVLKEREAGSKLAALDAPKSYGQRMADWERDRGLRNKSERAADRPERRTQRAEKRIASRY